MHLKYFYDYANHKVPHTYHGWNTKSYLTRPYVCMPCVCWGCVHMHLYVFAHKPVHLCVFLENGGPGYKVWMKYGSHLALCPPSPLPGGPLPWRFPWAIWSDEGGAVSWAEGWGVRFILAGCETSSITSQEPCWVTTLLWKRGWCGGMWGACAWPSVSVKCSVALKRLLAYWLKGALLHLIRHTPQSMSSLA